MSSKSYDDLLARMPEIAKAVNAFESHETQQSAFALLVQSLGITLDDHVSTVPELAVSDSGPATGRVQQEAQAASTAADRGSLNGKARKRTRSGATKPRLVDDLDFTPNGRTPWKQFISDKSPSNNEERALVAVYWLAEEAHVTSIDVNYVYSCFEMAKWRQPSDLANVLQATASRKRWLKTSDMNNITYTMIGKNHVGHDLPSKG